MNKIALFGLMILSITVHAQKNKILIVSTNRDSVGTHASGTYLPEIAYPFQYFTDNGYEVDIVTPKGGKASIYKRDMPTELEIIFTSKPFVEKTGQTLSPSSVKSNDYAAVFYPGGHGQYFDVVHDERIAQITAAIYEKGGVVGTAGHGVASLIDVRLSTGEYFVSGKKITCFPHWAERKWMNISGYGKLLAFDMEELLARRGAKLVVSSFDTRSDPTLTLVVDKPNRVVTGSFASSAKWVAEQMTILLSKSSR
jgi:putative intracellular protease/amidase